MAIHSAHELAHRSTAHRAEGETGLAIAVGRRAVEAALVASCERAEAHARLTLALALMDEFMEQEADTGQLERDLAESQKNLERAAELYEKAGSGWLAWRWPVPP